MILRNRGILIDYSRAHLKAAVKERHIERRLAAILAMDVAGYSRLMGADEVGTLRALQTHRKELIDLAIAAHHGRIVKTTGDGLLVEFASVVDAVACAAAIQRGMASRNAGVPQERRIEFRAGINIGDVIVEGNDIYGDGVNVAARLETLSEPGGVCISRTVRDQIRDKLPLAFADLGEKTVKNIARLVWVYALSAAEIAQLPETALAPSAPGRRRIAMWGGIAVAALLAVATIVVAAWWIGLGSEWKFLHSGDQFTKSAEVGTKPAIAIVPFLNQSDDSAREYFADGLTEDIINALG